MIELTSDADFRRAWPVMVQLRTDLDEPGYMELLSKMRPDGYRLFALEVDDDIKALAGVSIGTNFYYRRYLWVYDLITTETDRSSGHGAALMGELERFAARRGATRSLWRLDCTVRMHTGSTRIVWATYAFYTFHKTLD